MLAMFRWRQSARPLSATHVHEDVPGARVGDHRLWDARVGAPDPEQRRALALGEVGEEVWVFLVRLGCPLAVPPEELGGHVIDALDLALRAQGARARRAAAAAAAAGVVAEGRDGESWGQLCGAAGNSLARARRLSFMVSATCLETLGLGTDTVLASLYTRPYQGREKRAEQSSSAGGSCRTTRRAHARTTTNVTSAQAKASQ